LRQECNFAISASRSLQLLWEPLASHPGEAQVVPISPDAGLGRFPWPALPIDAAGGYLIERLSVAVVPVPQLIPPLTAAPVGEQPQVALCPVGDVDFGAEAGTSGEQVASRAAVGGRADVLRQWPRLPATRAEILAVRDSFESRHPDSQSLLRAPAIFIWQLMGFSHLRS
jgi:hypothetical protein